MDHDRWHDAHQRTLQMFLHGDPVGGDSLLLVVQGHHEPVTVTLPGEPWATSWDLLWDSAAHAAGDPLPERADGGTTVALPGRTVRLYRT